MQLLDHLNILAFHMALIQRFSPLPAVREFECADLRAHWYAFHGITIAEEVHIPF